MGSLHLQQLLTGFGRYRRSVGRIPKAARLSSSSRDSKPTEVDTIDSSAERKKSMLYTKTGDKGMSSVSDQHSLRE
jgi:hypothetical protein